MRPLIALAGIAALSGATLAQNTPPTPPPAQPNPSTPRTSPSTPQRTTPGTQPGTQPTQQQPTRQPTTTDPSTQPVLPPDATQQPVIDPNLPNRTVTNDPNRIFTVDPQQEGRFQQLSQRLARLEAQLAESNDRILQSLGEARQVGDTNQRIDRLAAVLQQVLLQNRVTLQYITEMRIALTGQVNAPANPQQPGATVPGSIGPDRTVPNQPDIAPNAAPGRTQPVTPPPANPQNPTPSPGSPATNPR
jgi:hypothetical protein